MRAFVARSESHGAQEDGGRFVTWVRRGDWGAEEFIILRKVYKIRKKS